MYLQDDIHWMTRNGFYAESPIEVHTNGHTIYIHPYATLSFDQNFNFYGDKTLFHVYEDGKLLIDYGRITKEESAEAEYQALPAIVTEDAEGLNFRLTEIAVSGQDCTAIEARDGLTLFYTSIYAKGAGATAVTGNGSVDLSFCQIEVEGSDSPPINTDGDIILDASYCHPVMPDAIIIDRDIAINDSLNQYFSIGSDINLYQQELSFIASAERLPDKFVPISSYWSLPAMDVTKEGRYQARITFEKPFEKLPFHTPEPTVANIYLFDTSQVRFYLAGNPPGEIDLYFFSPVQWNGNMDLYFSEDEGSHWEQWPADQLRLNPYFVNIPDLLERDKKYIFQGE